MLLKSRFVAYNSKYKLIEAGNDDRIAHVYMPGGHWKAKQIENMTYGNLFHLRVSR